MEKKRKGQAEVSKPLRYFVVIMHKKGAMPRMLLDKFDDPLTFDSEAEGRMVGKRYVKQTANHDWKFTVIKLED